MGQTDLREIDHEHWVPFLAEFSKAHFGEPVEVRIAGRAAATGGSLSVIADAVDPAAGERIDVVTAGERPEVYGVPHPIHVRVTDRADGRPLLVQIEDRDGNTTLVRFLRDGQARPSDA